MKDGGGGWRGVEEGGGVCVSGGSCEVGGVGGVGGVDGMDPPPPPSPPSLSPLPLPPCSVVRYLMNIVAREIQRLESNLRLVIRDRQRQRTEASIAAAVLSQVEPGEGRAQASGENLGEGCDALVAHVAASHVEVRELAFRVHHALYVVLMVRYEG